MTQLTARRGISRTGKKSRQADGATKHRDTISQWIEALDDPHVETALRRLRDNEFTKSDSADYFRNMLIRHGQGKLKSDALRYLKDKIDTQWPDG